MSSNILYLFRKIIIIKNWITALKFQKKLTLKNVLDNRLERDRYDILWLF